MKKILVLVILSLILSGCIKRYTCSIKRGMTQQEVIEACGEPDRVYNYIFRQEEAWEYHKSGSFYHRAGNKIVHFKNGKVLFYAD